MRIEFKSPQTGKPSRPPHNPGRKRSTEHDETPPTSSSTMYSMDYTRTQTAPYVGRHDKGTSLIGFDPLLMDSGSKEKELKLNQTSATLSSCGTATPKKPTEERDQTPSKPSANLDELRSELRAIAGEIGKLSPHKSTPQKDKAGVSAPTTPESSKNSTPVRSRRNFSIKSITPTAQKSSSKKKGSHRKTKSLDSSDGKHEDIIKEAIAPPSLQSPSHEQLSSPMMQELWEIHQISKSSESHEQIEALALPSLAKQRPTSFLTGTELQLTSETDATEWQVDIPAKEEFDFTTHLSLFLDSYRKEECLLDLSTLVGCSRQDLGYFSSGQTSLATEKIAPFHRPIVESLLECGSDLQQVQGYFRSKGVDNTPDGFREVLVLERQRQFVCAFRGTTMEQLGKVERQPNTTKLLDNGGVSVFADRHKAAYEFEPNLFALLDRLMEENPFCDFVFCGHGFGAAMATIAAYRYAWSRPELRVAALVSGSAKLGLNDFRLSAHSLGNLKVARLELGHVRPLTHTGYHIGHTIRLNPSKSSAPVRAYRFADTKPDPSPIRKLRLNKDKCVAEYVYAVEELGDAWVKNFYRQDGAGVRGKDNESRYMV